jgi:ribosome-binding protein aMBF1 (putative translation factor)
MTRHCHKCGWEWSLAGQPGRSESCHKCGADLRVCLNCASYDPRVAHQCRDRRADPLEEKQQGNFCEYFDFARRTFVAKQEKNSREDAAREQLKKLFGD